MRRARRRGFASQSKPLSRTLWLETCIRGQSGAFFSGSRTRQRSAGKQVKPVDLDREPQAMKESYTLLMNVGAMSGHEEFWTAFI